MVTSLSTDPEYGPCAMKPCLREDSDQSIRYAFHTTVLFLALLLSCSLITLVSSMIFALAGIVLLAGAQSYTGLFSVDGALAALCGSLLYGTVLTAVTFNPAVEVCHFLWPTFTASILGGMVSPAVGIVILSPTDVTPLLALTLSGSGVLAVAGVVALGTGSICLVERSGLREVVDHAFQD